MAFLVADSTTLKLKYQASLVYCDPPTNRGTNEAAHCDKLPEDDFFNFTRQWMNHATRLVGNPGRLVVCTFPKIRFKFEKILSEIIPFYGLEFEQELIWYYNFGLYTKRKFVSSHDNILVFRRGKPPFYWNAVAEPSQRLLSGDKRADKRGRTPGTVFSIPRVQGLSKNRVFLKDTFKRSSQPVELCRKILNAYTKPKDLVIDMFTGTGTMSLCCRHMGRPFVAIDISKQYIEEAIDRTEHEAERIFMEEM